MRKLILYIATSLDGYIARPDGRVDWLEAIPNPDLLDYGYDDLLAGIDTTLMGNSTYQVVLGMEGEFPYADKINYVFSRSARPDAPYVQFVAEDPVAFVRSLKQTDGQGIWLIGGGQINTILLNAGLIDELIVSVAPIVLGAGIPLFGDGATETPLTLVSSQAFDTGFIQMIYQPA
ncbi:dihydrofolate reductase family protein [Spirosoma sp. 209]|uniref:dihydrofolate reductase family protein n=1 Tax=Spirosoma sp. 209 TaxID=1955701 RepID=UPI00098D1028|nr:dihydrofolate reductase family protein [Spirosoma sp. 209]